MLEARNLTRRFGGLTAIQNVSLSVGEREIVGIIGPNGAGKTTLFNCLTGITHPNSGTISFQGRAIAPPVEDAARRAVHRLSRLLLIYPAIWAPIVAASLLWHVTFPFETLLAVIGLGALRAWTSWRLKAGLDWARSLTLFLAFTDLLLGGFWLFTLERFAGQKFFSQSPEGLGWLPLGPPMAAFSVLAILNALWTVRTLTLPEVRAVYGSQMRPDRVNALGLSRTFQNIRLFGSLNVLDNVRIGLHRRGRSGMLSSLFQTPGQRAEEEAITAEAMEWLRFVGIEERAVFLASTIPYGDQKRLEVARAMAGRPALLLLDEPAAGMNPQESAELVRLIGRIRERGVAILIIEHDMKVIMRICDRIVVLDHGEKIAEGTPAEVRTNPAVIEAYLGRSAA